MGDEETERVRKKTTSAIANATMFLKNPFWNAETGPPQSSHRRTNSAIRENPKALMMMERIPFALLFNDFTSRSSQS